MCRSTVDKMIVMKTAGARLGFDAESGRLVSFRPNVAPDQEFIASAEDHPVFVIQYLDDDHKVRELTSLHAEDVSISCSDNTVTMEFGRLGGLDLGAGVTVCAVTDDPMSRWSITVRNNTDLQLLSVQFPLTPPGDPRYSLNCSTSRTR